MNWGGASVAFGLLALVAAAPITGIVIIPFLVWLWRKS